MRRFGITASLAASIAVAAIVISCSSDSRTSDPPSAPGSNASGGVLGSVSLVGGGWSPPVEAAAQVGNKVTVCHSGNGSHFTQIDVSAQGARAHLGDPSSGHGGHKGDYRVSANTPCPPPATPGDVQVCKVAGVGMNVGTNFTFTVTANGQSKPVTVAAGAGPTGTCASAGSFRVGTTVTVSEGAQAAVKTASIVVTPAGAQQGTSDLANRSTMAIVGVGTTTLTFTNNGPSGTLVICKVAGTGVTAGTNFTFAVGSQTATVAGGAGPDGTCSAPMTLATGPVTVSETGSAGTIASAIAGTPALTNVNLPGRSATTQITADQQSHITFTNVVATASNSGTLNICKVAGTGVTAGTNFTFNVGGLTATVAAGAAPAGTCTATPITVAAGTVTVSENATSGVSLTSVAATGSGNVNALVSSDLGARSANVTVTAGQLTTVTFTNSSTASTGTLVICKIGGTGITAGTNFQFTAGGQTVTVAAGAAPNGTCSSPIALPAGAVTVTETAVTGTSVQAIAGTPAAPTNINLAGRTATVQIAAGQETHITFTNIAP